MIKTGTRLGPYEVVAPLGAGGMGEVYRARDTRLDRDVAIKILPSHLSSDAARRERFDREARAISRLSHPSVCTLFDVGHEDGIDYLVMEYLGGESLANVLARGPLPLDQLVRCGVAVAEALDHAHRNGIVHRDLKPDNIMLTKSGAKVLDFGLAKYITPEGPRPAASATQQKPLTEEGTLIGTMQYMAPEQLEGLEADSRTDIFALGSILYEMATGRHAFEAKSRASLIAAIMDRDPAPISTFQPMTPPALDQIVRRCLAKDPDDRFQSARDLAFDLQGLRGSAPQGEAAVGRPRRRTPLYAAAAAVVLLAVAGATAWVAFRRGATSTPASEQTTSVAVLPLANLGIDRSRDYLRLAIPDEITTLLTYAPQLAIRPFSVSRRLAGDIDPREAAKKLDASTIVSGHVMEEGGRLSVTLEAIDVRANRVLWHDVLDVSSADPLALRRGLANSINAGLLPRIAPASPQMPERQEPRNAEAYSLFLRAAAASSDQKPSAEALALLEESVRLDPSYAPAWAALAQRAYFSYAYSTGGPAELARASEAARRALQLDPDLIDAAGRLVIIGTESGNVIQAWRDAKKLLSRRPDSAEAHFLLSYALRYGGAAEEAARQCDAAWAIDSRNRFLRSCASPFMQLGRYDRALDFVDIEAGSEWSKNTTALVLLARGSGRQAVPLIQTDELRSVVAAWVDRKEPAKMNAAVTELRASMRNTIDGEAFYTTATVLSVCDRPKDALDLLRGAVQRNYCSYPAIDTDPMLAAVRRLPDYAAFRETAAACHAKFMEATR